MKNSIKSNFIVDFIVIVNLFLYIVGGNIQNFNIGGRVAIKICEIFSILTIFSILIYCKCFIKFNKLILSLFLWGIISIILIIFSFFYYNFNSNSILLGFLYLLRYIYNILSAFFIAKYIYI